MIPIPNDSLITFFDGFSKYAYCIYSANRNGYDLSSDRAKTNWILNSKKFFEYLLTRFDFTYDQYDMMAISEDFSMNNNAEELLEYFIRVSKSLTNGSEFVTHGHSDEFYWNISDEAKLSFFMGVSFIIPGDIKNRETNLLEMYKLVVKHLGLNITTERIHEIDNYFFTNDKIEEIMLIAFDMFKIKYMMSGDLKHMDKEIK